jgi:hypothetical protein
MSERSVSKVMSQTNSLSQNLMQLQSTRDCAANLRNLQRVSDARPVKIPFMIDEDLRFID